MKPLCLVILLLLNVGLSFGQDINSIVSKFNDYTTQNPIEKVYLHLDKPYYMAGEVVYIKAYLTDAHLNEDVVSRIIYVELSDTSKQIVKRILLYSDKKEFAGQIELPDSLPSNYYHLRAYTNWMRNAGEDFFFHSDIFIGNPALQNSSVKVYDYDYHVDFFPEGGHLLSGVENRVAFKALGSDGYGVDVTGLLKDDTGQVLLQFQSTHLGMGRFSFIPDENRTYSISTISKGMNKEYKLTSNTEGIQMSVSQTENEFCLTFRTVEPILDSIYLVAQSRQTVCYASKGLLQEQEKRMIIPKKHFPSGITQLTLFRGSRPVSERLIFIDRNDNLHISLMTDKNKYGDREKVKLHIQIQDMEGSPVEGSFSLSVTDDKVISPSIGKQNIKGSLLLDTDLKGFVENPGWYFDEDSPERAEALDILLCTQGWRRFSWEEITADAMHPIYPVEDDFKVTGKLVDMLGRPVKNGSVILLSNDKRDIPDFATTDEEGRFGFIGFNCTDTTKLFLQGRNKKGGRVFLDIKLDTIDTKAHQTYKPLIPQIVAREKREDYLEQAVLQKKYEENIWMINLPEISVVEMRSKEEKEKMIWNNMFSKKISDKQLNKNLPLKSVLKHVLFNTSPGIWILDGMEVAYESLQSLLESPAYYIESIEIISEKSGTAAYWGARGMFGAVIIKMKSPLAIMKDNEINPPGLILHNPEGYCIRKEFYMPAYDKPEIKDNPTPDLRTTIYWNPIIKTDKNGKATVEFYTADEVKTYSYVLEGIGNNKIGYVKY